MKQLAPLVLLFCATLAPAATLQYAATSAGVHAELGGATVKGKVNVRVAPCVAPGVKFYLDGVQYGNPEGGCPYDLGGDNFLWNSTTIADGSHTIQAREGNGVTVRATATFTVQNAAPPSCAPPQPSAETRMTSCVPPNTGGWVQTRSYSCVAPNWVAGAWAPVTAPSGVCVPPLPPLTMNVTPRGSALIDVPGTPVTVSWSASDPSATCLADFPGAPAGNPGSTVLVIPAPVVTTIEYRIGCVRAADSQVVRYLVTVQSRPPNLPPFPNLVPGCYPTEPGCAFVESTDGHVKAWTVDAADSVMLYHTSYNPGAYQPCVDSFTLTHANADRQWGRCKVAFNAADAAIADALDAKFLPRFTAVGGAVFYINLDGTLGAAQVREGAPLTVAAGEICGYGRKIMNNGKRYQRVHPAPDVNGNQFPDNAFAECTRQDAPVGGWLTP